MLFGISIQRLGLALAYAIVVGLGTLLGTLVPLFVQHRTQVSGPLLIRDSGRDYGDVGRNRTFRMGRADSGAWTECQVQPHLRHDTAQHVLVAVLCGILAPMLNYSFAFGQDIAETAVRLGNPEVRAAYAVWPIGLAGGLLPNVGYSILLLRRNRTRAHFQFIIPDLFWATLMAILWMGAFALYGMSTTYLGKFGTSIGWGLFQIFMIMTATLSGVLTGEWRFAPRSARTLLGLSILCLSGATALLAYANH